MSLKIAWAGPWNARSAIATFGAEVVAALTAAGHRVDVLRSEYGEDLELPALEAPGAVLPLAAVDVGRIHHTYDAVVANLGDHFGYHGALAPFLLSTDAIVIFHDAFLANFCTGWAHQLPDPEGALRTMVTAAYGADAMSAGDPFWLPPAEMARRRPMLELFAGQATAAIVHAGHYRARIAAACSGPVTAIPLAYRDFRIPARSRGDGLLEVATFGHANRNKRIGEVIRAIGGSDRLCGRCRYRVVGTIEAGEQRWIEAEMRAHGVAEVEFTGWVDDAALRDILAETDVICCLRHPVFEGGSASVIVAMLSGRTVLVSDDGVYAELPDDVVLKCRPGDEAPDVRRHLEAALGNREALWARGRRARAYAQERHSPVRYARDLIAAIELAQTGGPELRACLQLGRVLASLGLDENDPAADTIARTMEAMLGRGENGRLEITQKK